jgi:hypothetical protein
LPREREDQLLQSVCDVEKKLRLGRHQN